MENICWWDVKQKGFESGMLLYEMVTVNVPNACIVVFGEICVYCFFDKPTRMVNMNSFCCGIYIEYC